MGIDERLAELGLELPAAPQPVASYVPVVLAGPMAFVSGQIGMVDGQTLHPGRLGGEVTVEQGQEAARRCALQALAALKAEIGSLDRVRRIVMVNVFVASGLGFTEQPKVANGASDLLVEIFGDAGRHARTSVGPAQLPLGAPVEVALIAQID